MCYLRFVDVFCFFGFFSLCFVLKSIDILIFLVDILPLSSVYAWSFSVNGANEYSINFTIFLSFWEIALKCHICFVTSPTISSPLLSFAIPLSCHTLTHHITYGTILNNNNNLALATYIQNILFTKMFCICGVPLLVSVVAVIAHFS